MQDMEQIYEQYFETVYKYLFCLTRNSDISEELTQETFYRAVKKIHTFNGDCKISVWLCQIAKNTYFTYCKKEKRFSPELNIEQPDTGIDLEKSYLDKDDARRLHILLHKLDEPYKEVFTLRVFGDLPFSQIGELFGKTDSWARLVFYRAKKRLQEDIK